MPSPLPAFLLQRIPPADHAWLAVLLTYFGRASLHPIGSDGPDDDLHLLLAGGGGPYRLSLILLRQWHDHLRVGQPLDWAALRHHAAPSDNF